MPTRARALGPRHPGPDAPGRRGAAAPVPARRRRRRTLARVPGASRQGLHGVLPESSRPRRLARRGVDRAHLGPRVSLSRSARRARARARAPGGRLVRRLDRGGDRDDGVAPAGVARADRSGRHPRRRLDLSVPVRDGHSRDRHDDLPESDGGARPGAARSVGRDPGAPVSPGDRARARELESVSLQSAPAPPARSHHGADAPVLGRPRPAGAARPVRPGVGRARSSARACACSPIPATCRIWRSPRRWRTRSASSGRLREGAS